jgi:acetyltransferase-like isoleucine patch superfamily enzyme
MPVRIHPTAEVSTNVKLGDGTSVWHHAQVREDVAIGANCIVGKGVYIDAGVLIGDCVKIQNYVSIYHGVTIEDGVFIGPHVCFTNDLQPRAVNPDGLLKSADDWELSETLIRRGAALGANSTIRCGITIGEWAMIGAGSVVTRDIPSYGLVMGNPARLRGFVCPCGSKLGEGEQHGNLVDTVCPECGRKTSIPLKDWEKIQ